MSDDQSWVFDSLVCFLHGPIWNAPIQNFIEEKSIIFDPNEKHDQNTPEYKKLHNEYKNLVDFMLGSFMEELQITPEQFEVACLEGRGNVADATPGAFSFHQGLFQQIWAANDIRIFIKMMVQRNLEIQLQALDLIERQQSIEVDKEKEEEEEAAAASIDIPQDEVVLSTMQMIEEKLSEEKREPKTDEIQVTDKFKRLNLFFGKEEIDEQEVKQRQEYLRAQRDRILEIKKNARTRQFNETLKKAGSRPTSAQAAQRVLENNEAVISDANDASLQLRKTLARRLKTEVVEQNP